MAVSDYTPAVTDIAGLIPSRSAARFTGGGLSNDPPAFPDEPRVQRAIGMAVGLIAPRLGGDTLPAKFYAGAQAVIILKTALLLEPAAWPEQAAPERNAWEQWKQQLDDDLPGLIEAIKQDARDGDRGDGGPETALGLSVAYGFPPSGLLGYCPPEW